MLDEPSGGAWLQRRRRRAGVLQCHGCCAAMLGVPTDAPVDNVILPPPGSEIREET
jgi:ribosomal protein L34E